MADNRRRTRGDGGLFQRADGLWQATLDLGVDTNGKRVRWIGRSKDHDKALAKLRAARKERDESGVVASKTVTVSSWLDKWLEEIVEPNTRPRTSKGYAALSAREIKPRIGKVTLANLTPSQVRGMLVAIATDGRVATARAVHRVLRAALSDAIREGLVGRNVAAAVTPPKSTAVAREALTAAEARKVMSTTAADRLGSRWAFAIYAGVRQGEALGLTWDRVDLKAGTVDISRQLQRLPFTHGCGKQVGDKWPCDRKRGGSCSAKVLKFPPGFENEILEGGLVLTRPKTNAGTRVIPLPAQFVDVLKAHRKASLKEANPHGLVWHTPEGKPIDPKDDSAAWHAALKRAKVKDVPLHSARHTTATLLLELGVDPLVIRDVLGHTDVVTSQGYQHVNLDLSRAAMNRLGDKIG